MVRTNEVEINWNGRPEKVVLKRLTFGEKNKLSEDCTDIRLIAGKPSAKMSIAVMKELGLLKSIVTAPFPITIQSIQDLDPDIGELLFAKFEELNDLAEKKEEPSNSQ